MAELGCKPWSPSSTVQSPEVLLGLFYCGAACPFAQTVHCVDTSGCKGYWGALGEAALGSGSLAVSRGCPIMLPPGAVFPSSLLSH